MIEGAIAFTYETVCGTVGRPNRRHRIYSFIIQLDEALEQNILVSFILSLVAIIVSSYRISTTFKRRDILAAARVAVARTREYSRSKHGRRCKVHSLSRRNGKGFTL